MLVLSRFRTGFVVGAAALVLAACDDGPLTAPDPASDSPSDALSRTTTLTQLRDRAGARPVRLEIDVRAGGPPWVAREVEQEDDDDHDEKIEARIVAADPGAGTVVLGLAGLVIDLSATGRFRAEGAGELSREAFFARVGSALEAGRTPGVELRRRLPSSAQGPNDATFLPLDARLDDDAEFGKLEVLVDGRHVTAESDGRGRVTVFGIEIVVDPSLGSRVRERTERGDGAVEIEGVVEAVDVSGGRVLLFGGVELRIVEGTRFDDDGSDDELGSLDEVAVALAAGYWVEVEAEAVRGDDGAWIAVEAEFEVEDDVDDDDLPGSFEFEGDVVAADPALGMFTLADGTALTLDSSTRVDDEGDLFTLEQVVAALAEGVVVEAEGHLLPDAGAPGGLRVVSVTFEADDDGDGSGREFEGRLVAVDAGAGLFTLADGVSYQVTEATTFETDGDLFSLAAAGEALASGEAVTMEGDAVADASAPGGWRVVQVKIEIDD